MVTVWLCKRIAIVKMERMLTRCGYVALFGKQQFVVNSYARKINQYQSIHILDLADALQVPAGPENLKLAVTSKGNN